MFLTVMETIDVSNHKQMVILCVWWFSADVDVHEDFIGLSQVNKTDAGSYFNLVAVIRNIFEDKYISLVLQQWLT